MPSLSLSLFRDHVYVIQSSRHQSMRAPLYRRLLEVLLERGRLADPRQGQDDEEVGVFC